MSLPPPPPLTQAEANSLLRPPDPNPNLSYIEDERPWSVTVPTEHKLYNSILLRTFDDYSGSQPDPVTHRLLARAPDQNLGSFDSRHDALSIHADHAHWQATPFISFTCCPASLQDYIQMRLDQRKRGSNAKVVVVDPRVRLELGLPVVDFQAAIAEYKVALPAKYKGKVLRTEHYLCLWEVTPEEVVGVWEWKELQPFGDWYGKVIVPAVEAFRQQRMATLQAQVQVEEQREESEVAESVEQGVQGHDVGEGSENRGVDDDDENEADKEGEADDAGESDSENVRPDDGREVTAEQLAGLMDTLRV